MTKSPDEDFIDDDPALRSVDPENRIELTRFERWDDAELACGLLRFNGIACELSSMLIPGLPADMILWVNARDADLARALLADAEREASTQHDEAEGSPVGAPESESVHISRGFSASPESVFRAWIDPTILQHWLAPIANADARVGGQFRLEVSKPEGAHVVTGEYLEFIPNQRLTMTWVYRGPMAQSGKVEALLTVEFNAVGSNTEISLHHEHLTNPAYLDVIRKGAWTKALDELEKVLADLSK